MACLLVIIPDKLSCLEQKGEFTERYYNPGNLFDEVHIVMTVQDQILLKALQNTVGDAKLHLYSFPDPTRKLFLSPWFFIHTLLFTCEISNAYIKLKMLKQLEHWAKPIIDLAINIQPTLIRCYANDYNAFVAYKIKQKLSIPYIVSIHTNPDVSPTRKSVESHTFWGKAFSTIFNVIQQKGTLNADIVLPVYKSIIPYLHNLGIHNYEVAYNVLNHFSLKQKTDYSLHNPIKVISVGRHYHEKNPENIIKAVKDLPEVNLTLVGDGIYQDKLECLAEHLGISNRVFFIRALPNEQLCYILPDYDIFCVHNNALGIPKAVLEALLTGLPVILNRTEGAQAPELAESDIVHYVNNTPQSYHNALKILIENQQLREEYGKKAYKFSQKIWAPTKTEAHIVEIYQRILSKTTV